jgi:hypothetical protein
MTSFLNFHAFAAARGEGLRPELRALFERCAAAPRSELTVRNDGMVQSGPDPYPRRLRPSEETYRCVYRKPYPEFLSDRIG